MMDTEKTGTKKIAIFDFDGTLIHGDSLWPFLIRLAGPVSCGIALGHGVKSWIQIGKPNGQEFRTFLKSELLRTLLRDQKKPAIQNAATRLRSWMKPSPIMNKLRSHYADGFQIMIATGSLDLYMPTLLQDVPYDILLATEIGFENDICTGLMTKGNCVRQTKAERVSAYLKQHGPFETVWAYGNAPHDLPMMELADHRILVAL